MRAQILQFNGLSPLHFKTEERELDVVMSLIRESEELWKYRSTTADHRLPELTRFFYKTVPIQKCESMDVIEKKFAGEMQLSDKA